MSAMNDRCGFPDCPEVAVTPTGMCLLHRKVRVSECGSHVDDECKADKGHG